MATQSNAEGTVTQYSYDAMGHVVSAVAALSTSDQRTLQTQYDVQGRVTAQLSAGVRQYNEMVTAAAQLVSSANGGPDSGLAAAHRYRPELAGATDRLVGWAQAFDELGGLRGAG